MTLRAGVAIAALPLLLANAACTARSESPAFPPIVRADSAAVRAIYGREVTSDVNALMVAREALSIAGDTKAQKALDRYLARAAVATLAGNPMPAGATIGQIVDDAGDAPIIGETGAKILATTLRPHLAPVPNPEKHLPDMRFNPGEQREVAPNLWYSNIRDELGYILLVSIENAGPHTLSEVDVLLEIDLPLGTPARARCGGWPGEKFTPGKSWVRTCYFPAKDVALPQLITAVEAARKDDARWRLRASRIAFASPPLTLTTEDAVWAGHYRAQEQALAELRNTSCRARGSCIEELRRYVVEINPYAGFALAGLLAGLVAGALVGALTRHYFRWSALIAVTALGIGVVVTATFGNTRKNAWETVDAHLFVALALFGIWLGLAIGLGLGIGLAGLIRGAPAQKSGSAPAPPDPRSS